jgi:hypothetical protein
LTLGKKHSKCPIKIIEDHPYIRYSKPILSDEEMLARSLFF